MTRIGTDLVLLALASAMCVIAAAGVQARGDMNGRALTAALCVTLVVLLLTLMRRLELTLYPFVLLMTVVRIEPAPVDFMTMGLLGALAVRGELWRFAPPRIVAIGLALFLVSYVVAFVASPDVARVLRYTAATLLVLGMGFVAFELAARGPRIVERAYVLAATLLGVETIAALLRLPLTDELRRPNIPLRIEGLFKDPNVFGPFVVPAVLLLCVRWPRMPPTVRIAALALALAPVPASLSRTAVVALVVSLVVLGIIAGYRRWRRPLLYCLGILSAGVLALLTLLVMPGSSPAEDRMTTLLPANEAVRFAAQIAGLKHVFEHPFSPGLGPGNYEAVFGQAAHETYIRLLVETGPLSLIGLTLLLWGAIRLSRAPDAGSAAWVSALLGFVACGLFIDTLHWRHLWIVLVMPLAINAHNTAAVNAPPLAPDVSGFREGPFAQPRRAAKV